MVQWEIEFVEPFELASGDKLFVRFTDSGGVYAVVTDAEGNQKAPSVRLAHEPTDEELY